MRNVVVSGASRGLGLAIAQALVGAGFRVVALARNESAAFSAEAAGDGLRFWRCDLAEIERIGETVRAIRHEFGPLWGLVNNAGIGTSGLLAAMRLAEIEKTLQLNALAPIVLTRHVLRAMMADGSGGRIVNIASIVADTGFSGLSVYAASKAALVGFTRSLAREAGPLGITVNAVAPGFVDTAMTDGMEGARRDQVVRRSPLKRLAEPEDVAAGVAFLMSEAARNVTGTVLTIDAGSTA
ncbi:MAG TPA: SDR family oxidoreductase [Stellaceae bacterium]|nr:SDR family oxidoreductase [Stellaceae bacterium]